MRTWQYADLPLLSGGEDSASAPGGGDSRAAQRMENVQVVGDGRLRQIADWRLADTCKNATPVENHAVCGGPFPFATQGGASAPSAGIAFSFNTTDNKIYLHQLGEDSTILRTLEAYTAYAESAPPQMTGFEWFGLFFYCEDGREAAASRRGFAVFDPTGAGTVTHPTISIVAGGTGAALLRFRGIAKHRGGTVLGWGYRSEETGSVDRPDILRWSKYVATDLTVDAAWQPDLTPTSAGELVVGTLGLPIVGCCEAGQYTVIGKESEVFVLDGDYNDQFNTRRIGSHGPVSVTGLTSNGPTGFWLANAGIARSQGGGEVELITTNRLTNRLATYFDLTYACAVHDRMRTRVGWLLKRTATISGSAVTEFWGSEVLWYDYVRDDFHVQGLPTTCFTIGTTNGPGTSLAAPSGTVANIVVTPTSTTAAVVWDHSTGDLSAPMYLEYKKASDSTYTVLGPLAAGTVSQQLTSLTPATNYSAVRIRYFKNGQYGAYASGSTFTTAAASAVSSPTGVTYDPGGSSSDGKGHTLWTVLISWTRTEFAAGSTVEVWEATSNSFAAANRILTTGSVTTSTSSTRQESSVTNYYYWVRYVLSDGTTGTETAMTGNPIQYTASYLAF